MATSPTSSGSPLPGSGSDVGAFTPVSPASHLTPLTRRVGRPAPLLIPHSHLASVHSISPLSTPAASVRIGAGRISGDLIIGPDTAASGTLHIEPDREEDAEISIGTDELPEETIAALEHGKDIIVVNNHYVDPITGNVFTLNYGNDVSAEKWEECTRALIGNVCHRIEGFLLEQHEHGASFKEGLKDIQSYTFNWRQGTIELHMKGGTTHIIAAGKNLKDAMAHYLKDPKALENTPDPMKMTEGLGSITPELSSRARATLMYLACNPHTETRLEAAIAKLNQNEQKRKTSGSFTDRLSRLGDLFKTEEKEPLQAQRYRVLLETLRALKTGAHTELGERERDLLESALLPPSYSRIGQWLSPSKIDQDGDPWLQNAAADIQIQLDLYTLPDLRLPVGKVSLDYTKGQAVDLGNDEDLKQQLAARLVSDFEIDLKGAAGEFTGELCAHPKRAFLHLEPQINIAYAHKDAPAPAPIWAEVTQVTCLASKPGTKQTEASYIHFVKHGDKWWHMDGERPKEIPWSTVQQLAGYHASKIGFHVPTAPTATLARVRPSKTPALVSTHASPAPATALALTHGPLNTAGFNKGNWDDEVVPREKYTAQDALTSLRTYQAKTFVDDASRSEHLRQLYLPALGPILEANPQYRAANNTFSAEGRAAIEKFFMAMASNDHPHIPRHALCYHEMQEMADVTRHPLVIFTGPDESDRLLFIPKGTSLKAAGLVPGFPPLLFGAYGLNASDPMARVALTPLIVKQEIDAESESFESPSQSALRAILDFIRQEYKKVEGDSKAPAPAGIFDAGSPLPSPASLSRTDSSDSLELPSSTRGPIGGHPVSLLDSPLDSPRSFFGSGFPSSGGIPLPADPPRQPTGTRGSDDDDGSV
jgi:hypothetical protein